MLFASFIIIIQYYSDATNSLYRFNGTANTGSTLSTAVISSTVIAALIAGGFGLFQNRVNKDQNEKLQKLVGDQNEKLQKLVGDQNEKLEEFKQDLVKKQQAKTLEREITDKYFVQLQYHATSLAFRVMDSKTKNQDDYIKDVRTDRWIKLGHNDQAKHITEYHHVTTLYSLGTVLAFRKILLYGQFYSKIKEVTDASYVEQIRVSLDKVIEILKPISKSDRVHPRWFYYDNLLLGDLLTEEIGGNFRVSSYEKFLRLYQVDSVMRESIAFANIPGKLKGSEETPRLIIGLVKLINLLSDKTKIPPGTDLICKELPKHLIIEATIKCCTGPHKAVYQDPNLIDVNRLAKDIRKLYDLNIGDFPSDQDLSKKVEGEIVESVKSELLRRKNLMSDPPAVKEQLKKIGMGVLQKYSQGLHLKKQ
jgi:hypothetical protein